MKIGDQDWQRLANRHQRWQDALYGVFDGQRTQTMDGRVVLRHDVDAPCRGESFYMRLLTDSERSLRHAKSG